MFKSCEFIVFLLAFLHFVKDFYCNRICSEPIHRNELKDYCVTLASRYSPEDAYSEDETRLYSGCMDSNVQSENNGIGTTEKDEIGRCYLSGTMVKCISMSWNGKDAIVYSYYDDICHREQVIKGFFNSKGGGGGGSSGSNQSSSCFGGCNIM